MPDAIPSELLGTLDRIAKGQSFPHRNDGAVFGNREGLLPNKPRGYYREYVHHSDQVKARTKMASFLSEFSFDGGAVMLNPAEDFIAHVPPDICTRAALFKALRDALRLPAYFGENWDALSDCLRDLSWIEQHRVVLNHCELPQLDLRDLSAYLDVLSECVEDWKPGDVHQLVVVLPESARSAVSAIMEREPLSG